MFRKIVALSLLATVTFNMASAQGRDYRRERAELARQEKEERRKSRSERVDMNYGTNIIRVSPLTAMDLGVGFGMSYEKIFGKEQMVGLSLPVYVLLSNQDNYDPFYGGYGNNSNNNTYFYFNPGLKIYPFGQRRVTYAVGPSLMIGAGGGTEWQYNSSTMVQEQVDINKLRMGMLVNNYVNFQITRGFTLGVELGLGALYIDRETISRPNMSDQTYNNGINVTGAFSLTLGYRF